MAATAKLATALIAGAALALACAALAPAVSAAAGAPGRVCPLAGIAKRDSQCCPIYVVRAGADASGAVRCPPPCCPRRAGRPIVCPLSDGGHAAIVCPPPCAVRAAMGATVCPPPCVGDARASAVVGCPPPPRPHAYVTIASRRARVSRRHVARIRLRCHRGRGRCHGKLRLSAPFVADNIRTTGGRVRIGSRRYRIAAGASRRIAVRLNRTGRMLLANTHPHRIRARAKAGAARRTVVLRAKRHR